MEEEHVGGDDDLAGGQTLHQKLQGLKYKLAQREDDIEFANATLKDEQVELESKRSQRDMVKERLDACIAELEVGMRPVKDADAQMSVDAQTEVPRPRRAAHAAG